MTVLTPVGAMRLEWTFELVARLVQSHLLSGNPLAILNKVTDAETKELTDMYTQYWT